jgi:molybdopterin molybdotransferase
MDGYAVRAGDIATPSARLRVIGESAAGRGFDGEIGPGQAVRIFTGAPIPAGADTVLIQENARAEGCEIVAGEASERGRHIRPAGLDFRAGEVLLTAGRRLTASDTALAAAMNHAALPCRRRPRAAILATGDELVSPGTEPGPDQIVASNSFAVAAIVEEAGGSVVDLGIAADDLAVLTERFTRARDGGADLLITLGGASVGDHDLVQRALIRAGMTLGFWQIAMRPGKPLMHGHMGHMQILGLPGNPVSAIVCGLLFVRPLVKSLGGDRTAADDPSEPAILAAPLPANDSRQDYLRARFVRGRDGLPQAVAGSRQDSSMLKALSDAECLIIRPPHAPPAQPGDACRVIRL